MTPEEVAKYFIRDYATALDGKPMLEDGADVVLAELIEKLRERTINEAIERIEWDKKSHSHALLKDRYYEGKLDGFEAAITAASRMLVPPPEVPRTHLVDEHIDFILP